jgi:outer membrane murein-binding lipoprotein Lpp
MMRFAMLIAAAVFSSSLLAGNCPVEMRAIDAALPKAKLNEKQAAEVKKLRADGEKLHKEGKHAESMAALGKAKGILGIK